MTQRTLSPKQRRFVEEYLVDLNASEAAVRAGYSAKTAYAIAHKLLKNAEIQAAISEAQSERSTRTAITADYVLETIRETIERCRQAVPVRDSRGRIVEGKWRFDAKNVLKGTELLGRHLALFTDKLQVDDLSRLTDEELEQRIRALDARFPSLLPSTVWPKPRGNA